MNIFYPILETICLLSFLLMLLNPISLLFQLQKLFLFLLICFRFELLSNLTYIHLLLLAKTSSSDWCFRDSMQLGFNPIICASLIIITSFRFSSSHFLFHIKSSFPLTFLSLFKIPTLVVLNIINIYRSSFFFDFCKDMIFSFVFLQNYSVMESFFYLFEEWSSLFILLKEFVKLFFLLFSLFPKFLIIFSSDFMTLTYLLMFIFFELLWNFFHFLLLFDSFILFCSKSFLFLFDHFFLLLNKPSNQTACFLFFISIHFFFRKVISSSISCSLRIIIIIISVFWKLWFSVKIKTWSQTREIRS